MIPIDLRCNHPADLVKICIIFPLTRNKPSPIMTLQHIAQARAWGSGTESASLDNRSDRMLDMYTSTFAVSGKLVSLSDALNYKTL
jgi:hypothetical protein